MFVFCCLLFRIQEIQIRRLAKRMGKYEAAANFVSRPLASLLVNEETCIVTARIEEGGGGVRCVWTIYLSK